MIEKEINGVVYYYNENGKKLISFSGATKPFSEYKFLELPKQVLAKAQEFGKDLMHTLYCKLANVECDNTNKCFDNLLLKLKELNVKPLTMEKHIHNDIWHGYLDIDCENCFIEIKTRNNFDLELSTIVQCEVYKKITNKDYHILYCHKKKLECKELKPTQEQLDKSKKIIEAIELLFASF